MAAIASSVAAASAACPARMPGDANNNWIRVPAVTAHECSEIRGQIIKDKRIPFNYAHPNHAVPCVKGFVQTRVVRSTKTSELHFYYQVFPSYGDQSMKGDIIEQVTLYSFKWNQTWIGYRPDGPGTISPVSAAWLYGSDSIIRIKLPMKAYGDKDKNLYFGSGDKTRWIVIKTKAKDIAAIDENGMMDLKTFGHGYTIRIHGMFVPKK